MTSLSDCSGFARFRATPDSATLVFEVLASTPRPQLNSAKTAPITAKTALKSVFLLSHYLFSKDRRDYI
jgi:hypothetical protein